MTKIVLLSIASIFIFVTSCKKEKIELPTSNSPIFSTTGTFNGEAFELIAGDNDSYMHTWTDMTNGVEVVSGNLSNPINGLEIGIYSGQLDHNDIVLTENISLTPTFSEFNQIALATLSKNMFSSVSNIQSIEWIVNGEIRAEGYSIREPGHYDVTANVTFSDGSPIQTVSNKLILGYDRDFNLGISHNFDAASSLLVVRVEDFMGVVTSTSWYINDVSYGVSDSIELNIPQEFVEVRAEIEYMSGAKRTKRMLFDGALGTRTIEDFTEVENTIDNIVQDFNLRVRFEKANVLYESERANNSSSIVVITAFDYYGLNNAGYPVYKIGASINCNVRSESGGNDIPLQFNTVFGVEIR